MKKITANELMHSLKRNEVCLIDVREADEYKEQHIEHSYLIPLDKIAIETIPSREKPIVIHCKAGPRSIKACEILLNQNPSIDVYFLQGGITAWINAGYPTKHS